MPLPRIVSGPEDLARVTCRKFLTAPQLRDVCRARGFSVPGTKKDEIADAVAARLLGTSGVAEAMASLPAEGLVMLHAIATAETPPGLRDLLPAVAPGLKPWQADYRGLFGKVAEGLLRYGVVLVKDRDAFAGPARSRFENVSFVLPDTFRPLLPPFPVKTLPLPEPTAGGGVPAFAKRAIAAAAGGKTPGADLHSRVARGIRFSDGVLSIGSRALERAEPLVSFIRGEWVSGPAGRDAGEAKAVRRAVAHVLSSLPDGEGVRRTALRDAAGRLAGSAPAGVTDRLLAEGLEAGLLLAGGDGEDRVWRAAPEGGPDGAPLRFEADEDGVTVDVSGSGLAALCAAAAVSVVVPRDTGLHLAPDPARLGRRADRIADCPVLGTLARGSPIFARAVRAVEERWGKTLVHVGLAVLRVEEPVLYATIIHRFANSTREIGGPWIAVQPAALPGILAAAAKEGYHPRSGS